MNKLFQILIVFTLSFFIGCSNQEDSMKMKIAVVEFENNSGKSELEHLQKGIRDMLTTDIAQFKDIMVVERGRLDQILKEINISQTKYFDKTQSVKIGNLLGANYLLTGSYLLENDIFRIDVRLVKVDSAEIVYTQKIEGDKSEFFDLEKKLVSAIVAKIVPDTPQKAIHNIHQEQIKDFASFEIYSQAVYAQEKGKLSIALDLMQKAVEHDKTFKLAQKKLAVFQNLLVKRINDQAAENQKNIKSLQEKMDHDFNYNKQRSLVNDNSVEYYLALITIAAHEGLRANFQAERDMLLKFWQEYSNDNNAADIWPNLKLQLEKKSLFFEKNLMITSMSDDWYIKFSPEAEQRYSYPRFINMWPFCYSFGNILTKKHFNDCKEIALKNILPDSLFKYSFWYYFDGGMDLRDYTHSSPLDRSLNLTAFGQSYINLPRISYWRQMEIESQIICFYLKNKKIKIKKEHFNYLIEGLANLITACSKKSEFNNCSNAFAIVLIEHLHFISAHMKNGPDKIKIDQFVLSLTQYVNKNTN